MEADAEIDYTIKLLIVGDSSVGKSNFIYRFIENKFCQSYMTTTGIDLKTGNIDIENKKIRVQLWDTAGQEKYRAITKNLFLKVQGVLIIYDITNENSFQNLKSWVSTIKEECGHMEMLLIGNKSDLEEQRKVKKDEAIAFAQEEKIEYMETSSKTGENIHKAIGFICEKILNDTNFGRDYSFTLDQTAIVKNDKKNCC